MGKQKLPVVDLNRVRNYHNFGHKAVAFVHKVTIGPQISNTTTHDSQTTGGPHVSNL